MHKRTHAHTITSTHTAPDRGSPTQCREYASSNACPYDVRKSRAPRRSSSNRNIPELTPRRARREPMSRAHRSRSGNSSRGWRRDLRVRGRVCLGIGGVLGAQGGGRRRGSLGAALSPGPKSPASSETKLARPGIGLGRIPALYGRCPGDVLVLHCSYAAIICATPVNLTSTPLVLPWWCSWSSMVPHWFHNGTTL